MKVKLVIFILLASVSASFCQNGVLNRKEELKRVVETKTGQDKINAITGYVRYLSAAEPSEALRWGAIGDSLSARSGYLTGRVDIQVEIARAYSEINNHQNALSHARFALSLAQNNGYQRGVAKAKNVIGIILTDQGHFQEAIKTVQEAAAISENYRYRKEASDSYNILGILNLILRDYKKATELTLQALSIREEKKDQLGIAMSNENLGLIYMAQKRFREALKYHTVALRIKQELGDKSGYAGSLDNIAIIYRELKDYTRALSYCRQSLKIRNELNDRKGMGSVYSGMGKIYMMQGSYDAALSYLFQSYEIRLKIGDWRGARSSLSRISAVYEKDGDFRNALKYFKLYSDLNDSLYNWEKTRNVAEMQTKYETEKKDREIGFLEKEKRMADRQRNILIGVIAVITSLVIGILLLLSSLRRSNRRLNDRNGQIQQQKAAVEKLNEELKILNEEKDKLFSIIAHDLRSPFTAILGYSEFLLEDTETLSYEEMKEYSLAINQSSKRVYSLLENLLHWSRMNLDHVDYKPVRNNLRTIVQETAELYRSQLSEKQIDVECEIDSEMHVYADMHMLELVIRNLLSNAVKFSRPNGRILLSAREDGNRVVIGIEDNGTGINEEDLKNIFTSKMKSREGTSNEIGTGLGLLLCREMVEKNNGSISVESRLNHGTKFFITLPKSAPEFRAAEVQE